jgi:DNA-binding MarR family transcriptional regulator
MSRLVASLAADALVAREEDAKDGRGVILRCTRKGKHACRRAEEQISATLKEALSRLPRDRLLSLHSVVVSLVETRHDHMGAGKSDELS